MFWAMDMSEKNPATNNHWEENIKVFDGNEWQTYEMVLLESASPFSIDRHIDHHWSFISSEQDGLIVSRTLVWSSGCDWVTGSHALLSTVRSYMYSSPFETCNAFRSCVKYPTDNWQLKYVEPWRYTRLLIDAKLTCCGRK